MRALRIPRYEIPRLAGAWEREAEQRREGRHFASWLDVYFYAGSALD